MFWSLIVPRVQAVAVVVLAVLMLGWSVWFGVSTVADWILWRQHGLGCFRIDLEVQSWLPRSFADGAKEGCAALWRHGLEDLRVRFRAVCLHDEPDGAEYDRTAHHDHGGSIPPASPPTSRRAFRLPIDDIRVPRL